MKSSKISRSFRLFVAVIVLMFSGIIYAWSNISAPLSEMGWLSGALTFNYTLTIWFFCIGGLVSGLIAKKLSVRLRMILSALMLSAGFIITSCISIGDSIVTLYIAYGFLAGSGIGIVYNTVISAISPHFPDKKGFCSGILMMGFGIGAFIIGLCSSKLLAAEILGWRTLYRLLGIVSGGVIFFGSFVVAPPEATQGVSTSVSDGKDFTPSQMMKRPSFIKLFIFFVLFSAVGSSALALSRSFCGSLGIEAGNASLIAAFVSVTNSMGRLASGSAFDRLGLNKTKYLTSAVAIIAPFLSVIGIVTKLPVIAIIGLFLCGFSYGFSPTVSAAFTMEYYGKANYGANLGIINLVLIPGAFVPTLASFMVSSFGGSFVPVFLMLLGFSLIGLILIRSVKEA